MSDNMAESTFVWIHGFKVDDPDMDFNPNFDHAGCQLCGRVFQSELDRKENRSLQEVQTAYTLRQQWRVKHARLHTANERAKLLKSGNMVTPEAAQRLAGFGIIPLTDLVNDAEVSVALLESDPVPDMDAEC